MKSLTRIVAIFLLSPVALAAVPRAQITAEMEKIISPLQKADGWKTFESQHQDLFGNVNEKNPGSFLAVDDVGIKVEGEDYRIGMGVRSIWINASPKTVVEVVNNPHHFTSMYGLDKPADIYPVQPDGSFSAHIYKLVPGIETQDYTLNYTGHWDGDIWIQQAKLVKDERNFAIRDNIKIVEPSGKGAVFREVALLYPERWWMRMLNGVVKKIFKNELGKLNRSLKCAAETVQNGTPMSDTVAKKCYEDAQK